MKCGQTKAAVFIVDTWQQKYVTQFSTLNQLNVDYGDG